MFDIFNNLHVKVHNFFKFLLFFKILNNYYLKIPCNAPKLISYSYYSSSSIYYYILIQ